MMFRCCTSTARAVPAIAASIVTFTPTATAIAAVRTPLCPFAPTRIRIPAAALHPHRPFHLSASTAAPNPSPASSSSPFGDEGDEYSDSLSDFDPLATSAAAEGEEGEVDVQADENAVNAAASSSSLTDAPPRSPRAPSSPTIPKQRAAMFSKILRVIRSPTKGVVRSTSGDDYMLDPEEAASMSLDFPGLISANLNAGKLKGKRAQRRGGGQRSYAKGGRKSATARVWIQPALTKGTGDIYVNGKRYCEYFSELDNRWEVCAPFFHTHTLMDMDMIAIVSGGGKSGQAGAIKNAAAKALQAMDRKKYRPLLKARYLLSRDARVVERKKYGQKKARKKFTFVKR